MTLGVERKDGEGEIPAPLRDRSAVSVARVNLTKIVDPPASFWLSAFESTAAKGHGPKLLC